MEMSSWSHEDGDQDRRRRQPTGIGSNHLQSPMHPVGSGGGGASNGGGVDGIHHHDPSSPNGTSYVSSRQDDGLEQPTGLKRACRCLFLLRYMMGSTICFTLTAAVLFSFFCVVVLTVITNAGQQANVCWVDGGSSSDAGACHGCDTCERYASLVDLPPPCNFTYTAPIFCGVTATEDLNYTTSNKDEVYEAAMAMEDVRIFCHALRSGSLCRLS